MVSGAPITAAAIAPMPTSVNAVSSGMMFGAKVSTISASARPISAPTSNEEKNRPPRKPAPSEIAEASSFSARKATTALSAICENRTVEIAPWPPESVWILTAPSRPTRAPPAIGRTKRETRAMVRPRSISGTMRIQPIPITAQKIPSRMNHGKSQAVTLCVVWIASENGAPPKARIAIVAAIEAAITGAT